VVGDKFDESSISTYRDIVRSRVVEALREDQLAGDQAQFRVLRIDVTHQSMALPERRVTAGLMHLRVRRAYEVHTARNACITHIEQLGCRNLNARRQDPQEAWWRRIAATPQESMNVPPSRRPVGSRPP